MFRGLSPAFLWEILQPWSGIGEAIVRQLARLIEPEPAQEVLWIGCGRGQAVLWWTERFQTRTTGVDEDQQAVERAEELARRLGLTQAVTYQAASANDLPYEAGVFDVVVANLVTVGRVDPVRVIAEAGRVARPMAAVAVVVPAWTREVVADGQVQVERLGLSPRHLVEWKAALREAGVVELVAESAPDGEWIARGTLGSVARGWRIGGWNGVRAALSSEVRELRALVRARALALSLVKGTRWPHQ